MSYKSRFFAMVAAALLVVSLPSAGYAAGQTEAELARQIQAYVPGVGVDDILAGAREWSAESGQDVRTVLEDALEQARDNQAVQRRSGISERGSGVRDTELRKSDYKGDVFYEPVWPAGHVGILVGMTGLSKRPVLARCRIGNGCGIKGSSRGHGIFITTCRRRLRMRLLTTPIITFLSVPITLILL